ncbi:MAG: DUF4846 domain-containing protein [Bacteroidales bacterium]|nr:DUF4846 domain-containing protein [Bacteroidales bacterium]
MVIVNWSCKPAVDSQEFRQTKDSVKQSDKICDRIKLPEGYVRIEEKPGTFGYFLQNLVLLPKGSKVFYYNGLPKINQRVHVAVIDLDVGKRDLQQCADAVMRLRGEFLYSQKRHSEIAFHFVSDGKPRYFLGYSAGDTAYKAFRKYMDYVFSYANTRSLHGQLQKVASIDSMRIGDVFIQKREPYGHAVIVVDMAVNKTDGSKIYLLAQSYMPAQSIHILTNPVDKQLSPWYAISLSDEIITPEWVFNKDDLRRFVE